MKLSNRRTLILRLQRLGERQMKLSTRGVILPRAKPRSHESLKTSLGGKEFFYRLHYTFWSGSVSDSRQPQKHEFSVEAQNAKKADESAIGIACGFRAMKKSGWHGNRQYDGFHLLRIVVKEKTNSVELPWFPSQSSGRE